MKSVFLLALALASSMAFGSASRVLDGATITNSGVLTLPTTTDMLTGRATTDTFTNKTYDAAGTGNVLSNVANSNISSSAAIDFSKLATLTSAHILVGNGSNVAASVAVTGDVSITNAGVTAYAGTVLASKGGTGQTSLTSNNVLLGNGTSGVQFVAPGSSGNVLTSNGTTWTSAAPSGGSTPALNGGSGTPQSITAGTGLSLSGLTYGNFIWVVGNGGAVTVTATPSITACTADGQTLTILGTDDTNTVTLQDIAGLAGSALRLNGTWVGKKYSALYLTCDVTAGEWDEVSRR